MIDKNIITTAGIALIVGILATMGVDVAIDDEGYIPYTCDKETVDDLLCYKLSRVNDNGVQRNCYYDRDNSRKYKVCSTGWERMFNVDEFKPECNPIVIAYTDDGKWFCDDVGIDANCVKDGTIEMPFFN